MPSATVTSKGQVTIPQAIRRTLKVAAGDRLDFVVDAEGRVVVRPAVRDVAEIKGLLRRVGRKAVSVAEMNAAIVRQGGRGR